MTQSTEQERQDFEAWWSSPSVWSHGHKEAQWAAWQAARRAPAVPQGWKLVPKEATPEMLEQVWYLGHDEMRDAYCVLVAAAPQPPEALMSEILTSNRVQKQLCKSGSIKQKQ